jgi:hypothetical protein
MGMSDGLFWHHVCLCGNTGGNYVYCPIHATGASGYSVSMLTSTMRVTQRFESWNVALGWALNLWRTGRCEGKPTVRRDATAWCVAYKPRWTITNAA